MSMSMRDTIQNDKAKEDIKALMKSALKKPNAAVGQSGLQVNQKTDYNAILSIKYLTITFKIRPQFQ
jgi:hypothetical protein